MADTKKEHYVPRCYLENFEGSDNRIYVYDKALMQMRNQRKEKIAAENYFYDINYDKLLNSIDTDKYQIVIDDIKRIAKKDYWDEVRALFLDPKYIEKRFLCRVEDEYSALLKSIISKSYNGNEWVIKNCKAFSDDDKIRLSLFVAIQIIRTKRLRDTLKEMVEKTYQIILYNQQTDVDNLLPKEEFSVETNPDYIQLLHAELILDEEFGARIAETLFDHIWVMYVNKTDEPFFTSDDPVVIIPHKQDKYRSYSGLSSEGVEIAFPLSPKLLIAMYDRRWYSSVCKDRSFFRLDKISDIEYFNNAQVKNSHRCVFSQKNNFTIAESLCRLYPEIREQSNRVEVY